MYLFEVSYHKKSTQFVVLNSNRNSKYPSVLQKLLHILYINEYKWKIVWKYDPWFVRLVFFLKHAFYPKRPKCETRDGFDNLPRAIVDLCMFLFNKYVIYTCNTINLVWLAFLSYIQMMNFEITDILGLFFSHYMWKKCVQSMLCNALDIWVQYSLIVVKVH
jgi:hypothetical protein